MTDLVVAAIARTLGVSSKFISGWELNAQMDGRPGMAGMLRTELQVKVVADRQTLQRFQNRDSRGSWALHAVAVDMQSPMEVPARLDVKLLYGKETQHIFKALAQQTVYRRNQKGRRK